jgi:hypothetical protein
VDDVIMVAARAIHTAAKPEWDWDDPSCGSIRAFYCAAAEAALVAAAGYSDDALEDAAKALYQRVAQTAWDDAPDVDRKQFRRHVEAVVSVLERKGVSK